MEGSYEQLKLCTEALSSSPVPNSNVQHLYPLLSTVRFTPEQREEFKTIVIPDIYSLVKKHTLRKDLIYLSLLINQDSGVLEIFLEHECELPLNFRSSTSLFIQAYKHKRYWLESVLQNEFPNVFSDDIKRNIRVVQLLHLTNKRDIDLDSIRTLLDTDLEHEDDFVKLYVGEIRYILEIIEFMNLQETTPTELFNYINRNSLLCVFNEYLDLNDTGRWDLISAKLSEDVSRKSSYEYNSEKVADYSDVEVFKIFTIMHDVIECIKSHSGGAVMQRNEVIFSELNNEELQIELLECIFSLCFVRREHFINAKESNDCGGFLCSAQELQMILVFLKACMDKLRGSGNPRLKQLGRYTSEGLWRLELVNSVKRVGEEKEFLSYMLANPESLICMCLKKGRFDRALEVIQIFNLEDTDLAKNIIYTNRLNNLRASLAKSFKLKDYQKNIPSLPSNQPSPEKIIQDFFTTTKSDKFCDILDVALVCNENYDNTKEILESAQAHQTGTEYPESYSKFYTNLTDLFLKTEGLTIGEILLEPKHELSYEKNKIREGFNTDLQTLLQSFNASLQLKPAGSFSSKHPAHDAFMKLNLLLGNATPKYIQRFFNYLRLLFSLFQIEGNNTDLISRGKSVSYFEILKLSRTEIFRKLIYERGLDPRDFSEICAKLKIDCLYHTGLNCFPKIQLQTEDEQIVSPLQPPPKIVFTYITRSNWLLAYVIQEIFNLDDLTIEVNENRTKYFTQYINSDTINRLKILFNNNKIITGLHNNYFTRCMDYINKNVFHDQDGKFELSNDSFEDGTEIIEGDCSCNWRYLLELVESIPEQQLEKEQQRVDKMKDRILSNLVLDSYEINHYKYVQFIKDDGLRWDVIFEHFSSWPGSFCITLLNMELAQPEVACRSVLRDWLKVIEFCEEVAQLCDFKIWFDVHELCCENQEEMMQKLLCNPKVDLLLNFIDLYKADDLLPTAIKQECIATLLKNNQRLESVEELMTKLPDPLIIDISKNLLLSLRNTEQIQFLINYLIKIGHSTLFLKNIQLSLNMLELFSSIEREPLWCLLSKPMDIVETLVMNTKLDKFGAIMEILRPELETCELDDEDISVESVDELLRKYSEKSLEFRVIVQPHPKLLQGSDNKLMQSLDSLYGPDRKCFVMPPTVPDRTEWVPNNEVVECMCCQNTVFSMFNRRHHCRRCGRIICFNCSTRRMHVPTYGSILVRVCIDCYDQSHDGTTSMSSDNASNKSIIYDFWLLTDDEEQNVIVRREFSYEHAPSVSLCLSIMKHHSKNMHYARFLLDQCDNMLKLLQPVAPNGPHEVDYSLVVKMMKSLAIAAKMLSSECHLQWGASQADRILSQADLFGLLAERGGLNLLANDSPYVDRRVLRRLRDNLLEREQWNFALDVSTKAGLDNAGVFAAWGKSYLKAGCLQQAREKFHRCLDKSPHYDTSDYSLDDSFENTSRKRQSSRASSILDTKPSKNPPLLNQIIQILEAQTVKFDHRTKKDLFNIKVRSQSTTPKTKSSDPAICIKSKLKNLKAVAAGNYDQLESVNNRLDPVFFDECVYYLGKYGTHSSLLEFYIRHECLGDALNYMIDNRVSAEVFIEVYVSCLNEGKVNEFQEGMAAVDSTLDIWKEHLKQICRYLEKQGLLNSLYQLQQFMGDYVRAAMTCIRFYKDNVTCYRELLSNVHFLHKAEDHMKQDLEQQEWVHTVRRMSSDSRNSCFEEKSLTNPSLVMRMNSREVEKHIYTIRRQIEVTKFLAKVEKDDKHLFGILPSITPSMNEDIKECVVTHMPTLFDSQHEKVQLTVLILICATDVSDGYQLAHQIIQEYKLKAIKVYCQAGRLLANDGRYEAVSQLVSCICSSGTTDSGITDMCDELLAAAIRATDTPTPSTEALVKLITDKAMKISMYIEMKQLKSAYLLAAKYNRFGDIRRILREAELINKPDIKKLCQKLLQAHSHSHI